MLKQIRGKIMTKMLKAHIEYLREMTSDANEFLANEAEKELSEIMTDLNSKGIIVI